MPVAVALKITVSSDWICQLHYVAFWDTAGLALDK